MIERTLSIIKPDGVQKNLIGTILSRFESCGLKIVSARLLRLTQDQAQIFYKEHEDKPFYRSLVDFMCSDFIFVSVLEGENAIRINRILMGPTDPTEADEELDIRGIYGTELPYNIVHGSDSIESAKREIELFSEIL
jgi:nucleoside-diphosphate kinase